MGIPSAPNAIVAIPPPPYTCADARALVPPEFESNECERAIARSNSNSSSLSYTCKRMAALPRRQSDMGKFVSMSSPLQR